MIRTEVKGNKFLLISESFYEGHRTFDTAEELKNDIAEEVFNNGIDVEDIKAYEVVREIKITNGVELS